MKKLMFVSLLAIGLLPIPGKCQITVLSPNGGEQLPKNGSLSFWWSNSVPLMVSEQLERYDDTGALIQVFPMNGKGYYIGGEDLAYNLYDISTTNMPLGRYKLSVTGWSKDGQVFTDKSDDYFYLTGDATSGVSADTSDWLPGNTKRFTLEWDGLGVGDPYTVYLLSTEYIGEGYGFIVASGTIQSNTGSITFDALFPTRQTAIFPDPADQFKAGWPIDPQDATHTFVFIDQRNGIRSQSEPFRLVLADIHLQVFAQKDFSAHMDESIEPLAITIDAEYSHDEVREMILPVHFYAEAGSVFDCALYDERKRVSPVQTVVMGDKGKGDFSFTLHDVKIPRGSQKTLALRCKQVQGSGLCEFGFVPEFPIRVFGKHHDALSTPNYFRGYGPLVTIIP